MKNSATIIPVSSSDCQVDSWKTQLKTAFSDTQSLLKFLHIDSANPAIELDNTPKFPIRVPRAFAEKMEKGNINDPLLLQVLSQQRENFEVAGYSKDPLEEQQDHRPGLLHKYNGRVLLLLTGSCAINCRYCFRRHFPYQSSGSEAGHLQSNINYIADNPSITEVILSGGDPLIVSDRQLADLVTQLQDIPHVMRLRIHSRLPVVIPQRITDSLVQTLSRSRLQTNLVIHANHANEIDKQTGQSLQKLVHSGTNLFNQSVLLKHINDDSKTLQQLSERLIKYQIIPYYLHLLDPVEGAQHFEQCRQKAIELINQMRQQMPGYLVPRLAMEEPNKPSKTLIFG